MNIAIKLIEILTVLAISGLVQAGANKSKNDLEIMTTELAKKITPVDEFIYRGPRPSDDSDYELLKNEYHISTIISLETMPWHTIPEHRAAHHYRINYIRVGMIPSPIEPRESTVERAVQALMDGRARKEKVYLHCLLGLDRTGLVIAEYRIRTGELTERQAWDEMQAQGFADRFLIHGIEEYFLDHHPQLKKEIEAEEKIREAKEEADEESKEKIERENRVKSKEEIHENITHAHNADQKAAG